MPLPRWAWIGAPALSAVAGMVNVVGYLGSEHQVVSHLTGTTSLLGAAVAQWRWPDIAFLWGVLIAFCAGATLSGLILHEQALRLGPRYGIALLIETLLLLAAIALFKQHASGGVLMAAAACGLQNAMTTTYSGALVRTTHLSGMFTDLGIGLGQRLRGHPLPFRRLFLSGLIVSGFFGGSIAGAWLFQYWQYDTLYLPASVTGLSGAGYLLCRRWHRRQAR
ncbi:YoaK family protein [Xanthomonas maliensis]|uniref:YoaK family protein n=1 Tax=Xanthomonas maliensis TaxID=1321368 RepID=UPI003CCD714A